MTHDASLPERLRKLRHSRQLTQTAVADMLGLSSNTQVSRWESGRGEPTLSTLRELARLLGADLHWLITGEMSPITNALLPFARAHVQGLGKQIHQLQDELNRLEITGSPMDLGRIYEIREELESLSLFQDTIREHFHKVLNPLSPFYAPKDKPAPPPPAQP